MKNKIKFGSPNKEIIDINDSLPKFIKFGNHQQDFSSFILNQGWFRPRDIVRFLKCYQKKNGGKTRVDEEGIKNCLDEYARISAKEAFDELSVKYGKDIIELFRKIVQKRTYSDFNDLRSQLGILENRLDIAEFIDDLFQAGIILNVDFGPSRPRYFSSYREEENLDENMSISVHPGLINFFNVRHR